MNPEAFRLRPIGVVRCEAATVADVPSEGLPSTVVVDPAYADALVGVEVGDHVHVITVFHLADPTVLQGSPATEHTQGAFSIRSSCRPNLLGMTVAKVTAIDGLNVSFDWLDFVDGTPVVDLKRYNWRWECILSARRLDRRFIEQQIDPLALATVFERPAVNFHGEACAATARAGLLAAKLSQEHGVRIHDPAFRVRVRGDGHWVDAMQALTAATLGNGRLEIIVDAGGAEVTLDSGASVVHAEWRGDDWLIE
ncbi:SAM-dependent methyltransferase [Propioniciclava sp. MC1683]|uniref:TrmO family methyltransferase domain-containing protein n=1 Tax=Propioniciclava sp. MC1683 TaxID=2760309 RepID=UPI0015FFDD4D|nr:TrmO family methyltransferase [Propioniciclava sp. MC1683]MBB1502209.1 SAM-dependent methyltransferase [Propioniciclava sp. MC1683]